MIKRIAIVLTLLIAMSQQLIAQDSLIYEASLVNTMSSGDFAPYYMTANRHGLVTQSANVLLDLKAVKPLDLGRRFSWGAGAEVAGGWNEGTIYQRYHNGEWVDNDRNGRRLLLQQLYAEVKFRGVYLTAGIKAHTSAMLNQELSSGDLTISGNSSPMPGVMAGFVDFQNIPFTNGWVQIQAVGGYEWFIDKSWWENHFNYYDGHITDGSVMCYRRCYFRTKPAKPFSVTVGAQFSTVFGGTLHQYKNGELYRTQTMGKSFSDFLEAMLPVSNKEDFRLGNSLGSWDLEARYRFRNGAEAKAYFQWPWEDGSGIGRRNGFDGLWGLEYKAAQRGWVDGAVIEYLDFTNQSGPLHWAPGDHPGTTIDKPATGADDYYNNFYYNPYANYGMAIGTPFMKSPLFNTNGYMGFLCSRMRGFHAAVSGSPVSGLHYRAMISYRKAWGNGMIILPEPQHSTSFMIEADYDIRRVKGLNVKAAFALDHGNMFGNNSGAELTVSYSGNLSFKR